MISPDADAILASLEASPEDWDAWLVLADAHEDAGDPKRAHACRWMGTRKKRPFRCDSVNPGVVLWAWLAGDARPWGFYGKFNREQHLVLEQDKPCRLGGAVMGSETYAARLSLAEAVGWLANRLEGLRRAYEVAP